MTDAPDSRLTRLKSTLLACTTDAHTTGPSRRMRSWLRTFNHCSSLGFAWSHLGGSTVRYVASAGSNRRGVSPMSCRTASIGDAVASGPASGGPRMSGCVGCTHGAGLAAFLTGLRATDFEDAG